MLRLWRVSSRVMRMGEELRKSKKTISRSEVVATTRVHGGDTATAYRVDLADGRRVFAKTHAAPPAHFFSTEATGLRWLRDYRRTRNIGCF